ncbi:MAG: DMT family transporter [Alcanivoracaceae bacterium]|nr:DMT family transporter [Alcanivoracaceae bacterium]
MTNYSLNIIKMLLAAVIISTSSVWVKIAQVAPSVSGFYRMFIGGLVLLFFCGVKRLDLWRNWRYFGWLFLAAIFFALDLFFWHRSIFYIGPGLATVLGNFQVFFMALAGYLFFKEQIGMAFIIGLGITISGLFLLVGINWSALSSQYQTGVIYALLTAVVYTGFMLSLRHVQSSRNSLSAMANLGIMSITCAFIMLVVLNFEGLNIAIPSTQSLLSLLILGIVCQVLGWLLITQSMPNLPASIVGMVLLLQPALSMLWDVLFFARPTGLIDIIGLIMVLAGVYLATLRKAGKN